MMIWTAPGDPLDKWWLIPVVCLALGVSVIVVALVLVWAFGG